jgi:hypothetical protein
MDDEVLHGDYRCHGMEQINAEQLFDGFLHPLTLGR